MSSERNVFSPEFIWCWKKGHSCYQPRRSRECKRKSVRSYIVHQHMSAFTLPGLPLRSFRGASYLSVPVASACCTCPMRMTSVSLWWSYPRPNPSRRRPRSRRTKKEVRWGQAHGNEKAFEKKVAAATAGAKKKEPRKRPRRKRNDKPLLGIL